jgi:hypothetical protein
VILLLDTDSWGGQEMLNEGDTKVVFTDWQSRAISTKDALELINEAPVDGLLCMFYSAAQSESYGPTESDFMKTLLTGRYTEASVKSMNRLTDALNRAGNSSSIIGLGLVVLGAAQVIVALLGYLK